jgi:hypothetical protein
VHTAQSHPSVGTPIEVPVPKNVRLPSIRYFQNRFEDDENS